MQRRRPRLAGAPTVGPAPHPFRPAGRWRPRSEVLAALSLAPAAAPAARAQVSGATSDVAHRLQLTPVAPVSVGVTGLAFQHVWTQHLSGGDPFRCLVNGLACPGGQPAGFDPRGPNVVTPIGQVRNTNASGGTTPVVLGSFAVAPSGVSGPAGISSSVLPLGATTRSTAFAQVLNGGGGRPRAAAFAFSGMRVAGTSGLRRAGVAWNPISSLPGNPREGSCGGGLTPARPCNGRARWDPIWFDVLDPGGAVTSGTLLDVQWTVGENGVFAWDSDAGTLEVDALTLDFDVDLTSPFIPVGQRGGIAFEVRDGVVTRSDLSGIFVGLLPGVGASGTFSRTLGPFAFDYDLSGVGSADAEVRLGFAGAAFSSAQVVPEPSTGGLLLGGAAAWALAGVRGRRRAR